MVDGVPDLKTNDAPTEKHYWIGRDRLLEAKFKGIPFLCDDHEMETGRKWAAHEYPFRDLPYHEDMGQATKRFSINAYIIAKPGSDYKKQLDHLLAACESPGPGTLVHPFLGEYSGKVGKKPAVVCKSALLRENAVREGGVARLVLTFEMTGTPPVAGENFKFVAWGAKKTLNDAIAEFAKKLNFDGPNFITGGFISDITEFASSAQQVIGSIPDIYRQSAVGGLMEDLTQLDAAVAGAINSIPDVVEQIQDTISSIVDFPTSNLTFSAFNSLLEFTKFGDSDDPMSFQDDLEPIRSGTPSRDQQSENREILFSLIRQTAIAAGAAVALKMTLSSREDTEYIRNSIGEALSKEMQRAGDMDNDICYRAMQELRNNLFKYLQQAAGTLPQIKKYTIPSAVIPAVVLAYKEYEDLDREQEIIDRNKNITHPGFLPQGEDLELLSE